MNSKWLFPYSLLQILFAFFATSFLSLAQEISVEFPSGTLLEDGVSTLDFGSGAVGAMSSAKIVTIRNDGAATLTGLEVSVTGAQADEFSVNTAGMAGTLASGRTVSLYLTATPGSTGVREASIQISSNDADESPFDVPLSVTGVAALDVVQQAYVKASTPGDTDLFGFSVALSGDTAVVGAYLEDSGAVGIDGSQADNGESNAGAAYVFVRSGTTWVQQAYLKASNTGASDFFGRSVAIEGDTIAVGAVGEDSNATGVNGNQSNNSASSSGAVYVFVRNGTTWIQQAYLKASNTAVDASFGWKVALSGETLAVGVDWENTGGTHSGGAYVFVRDGTAWSQQAFLKASNVQAYDEFGMSIAIAGDTLVVGASGEDGDGTGQANNSAVDSGAAYVFARSGTSWTQQGYLKASNLGSGDLFGAAVGISGDTLVVGAPGEDSSATGINGNQANDSLPSSGAAYVFTRSGTSWGQQAYLKASNTDAGDAFGDSVDLDGDYLAIGAPSEAGNAVGVNSYQLSNGAVASGSAYLFVRSTAGWSQQAYLKASSTRPGDNFGLMTSLSGSTLLVGSPRRDGDSSGVNGDQGNGGLTDTGAVNVFEFPAEPSAAPEIFVQSVAGNVLSDGGSADLGAVFLGEAEVHAFTIHNPGTVDLSGIAISLVGQHAAEFEITGAPGTPIPPGGSATFNLVFNPTVRSSKSVVLRIASNDANENPFDLSLSAQGVIPEEITVHHTIPAHVELTDGGAAPEFPATATGLASEARWFRITNSGDFPLTGLTTALGGSHAADFSISNLGVTTLAPGVSRSFSVTFTPSADGPREALLSISSSDADENPFTIALSGTGAFLPPEISVEMGGSVLASGQGAVSFSGSGHERTLMIRNVGSEPLSGFGLSVTGADAASFSFGSAGTGTLASGSSTTFTVMFASNDRRSHQATLAITSNDADENPFLIPLTGTHFGAYYWDHFAGSTADPTVGGNTYGTGASARFLRPWGAAIDSNGTMYLADTSNHQIKKVTPGGVVTPFASSGFNFPNRVAVDAAGFVYVTDTFNDRIQKIAPNGQQSTLASGISLPRAIALDASGNVFVAAAGDHTIRMISPAGVVSLLAGSPGAPGTANGTGTAARFNAPAGIAVGPDDVLYVADTDNNRLRKITGNVVTSFGPAFFGSPRGIAVDGAGVLFVATAADHRIHAVLPTGESGVIGNLSGGSGNNAGFKQTSLFNEPASVAVGPGGALYVVGGLNNNVMIGRPQIPGPGEIMLENVGTRTAVIPGGTEDFHQVTTGTQVLRVFNINTNASATISGDHASDFTYTRTSTALTLRFRPFALGIRNAQLRIGSAEFPYILNLTGTGVAPFVWSAIAGSGTEPPVAGAQDGVGRAARFANPAGVAADTDGNLFIADRGNHVIRKITPGGVVTTFAGLSGVSGNSDGAAGEARFDSPRGIAIGPGNVLYVADTGSVRKIASDRSVSTMGSGTFVWGIAVSATGEVFGSDGNRIIRITPQGVGSVYAGTALGGVSDGPALSATFSGPRGVAFDAEGNLVVVDYGNRLIRKISPAGMVSTFAGSGVQGSADGQGRLATFDLPAGIGLDGSGNLFVIDRSRIRRISPSAQVMTVGGSAIGNREGVGMAARFNSPLGIAATLDGRIHVAGGSNSNIMNGSPLVVGPDIAVLPPGDMSIANGGSGGNLGEAPGAPVTRTFAIRNYGLGSLENLSLSLRAGSSPDFILDAAATATALASGGETAFSVNFTPSSTGLRTASVEIASNDPDETPFVIHLTGTGLTVREEWRLDHFGSWANAGEGADGSDPDRDGLENLLEFAFNLDPHLAGVPLLAEPGGSVGLPLIRNVGGQLRIEYLRRKAPFADGIIYRPQFGSSLGGAPPDGWTDVSSSETVTDIDPVWERVMVEDPAPGAPRRFGRVKVTAP